jgi:hypothetical protein
VTTQALAAQPHPDTVVVYQTLSPGQLAVLEGSDWRCISPGQGGEYFCYLKLQQRYAEMIARQWVVPVHGAAWVVRLTLPLEALAKYDLVSVAYEEHLEYQVPVAELHRLGSQLVGEAQVVATFRQQHSHSVPAGARPLAALMS